MKNPIMLYIASMLFATIVTVLVLHNPNKSGSPTAADVNELHSTVVDLQQGEVRTLLEREQQNREQIIFLKGFLCKANYLNNCMTEVQQ